MSPEDIRAAAEVHRDLGPEYSDAVVASFLEKVDRELAARVEARLAGLPHAQSPHAQSPHAQSATPYNRTRVKAVVVGTAVGASSIMAAMSGNTVEGRHRFLLVLVIWLVLAAGYALVTGRLRQQSASRRTASR